MGIDRPRRICLEILLRVESEDAYANLILPAAISDASLEERDAAFVTEITYGTLRMRGLYDAVLDEVSSRSVLAMDIEIRCILRLGAHQILSMRTPVHAAVDTSVDLALKYVGRSGSKFVNAIMRRVSERSFEEWISIVTAGKSVADSLAIKYSHPVWIVNAYRDALGTWEATELALASNNEPAPLTLVARPGRSTGQELLDQGGEKGALTPFSYRWRGPLKNVRGLSTGAVGVQDEGSQLVTLLTAIAPCELQESQWLDLCAGPGGKAALLESLAKERGICLVANEVAPHRAELVRHVLMHPENVVSMDGRAPDWAPATFDRVLVDAPCSGLGALRRRPEARWRKQPSDLPSLIALQEALLASALRLVKPGGLVAYVTCSPHVGETRGVIDRIMRDDAFVLVDLPQPWQKRGPLLQLWPHTDGTDAMFLALIRKVR